MAKFLFVLSVLAILGGAAVCAFGYYDGNNEVGGDGLFTAAGGACLLVLAGVVRMVFGGKRKKIADMDRQDRDNRDRDEFPNFDSRRGKDQQ